MKKTLLDVVFASEKRKQVILLLQEEPQEMEYLLKSLSTTRQALLPQIKILEEHHLVSHYRDTYELTAIGKLIADEMSHLVNIIETFDSDIDYWGTRNLDFIPPHLLKRISELKNCIIISPSLSELYSIHKSLNPEFKVSSSVCTVTTILYPDYESIFKEMLESNLTIHYLISQELFNKIRKEHREDFTDFIQNDSFNMYVYNKEMSFLYFTFDNVHSVLSMLKRNGEFDHKFMLCRCEIAVQWIKDLFEYYLENSTPITQI